MILKADTLKLKVAHELSIPRKNKDIRDVISLGKLIRKGDGPDEIEGLVKTLAKYTDDMN